MDDQVADGGAQVAVLAGVDQLPQVDDDLCRGESGIGAQVGGRGAGVRSAAWMVISCQEMPWTPVTTPTGTLLGEDGALFDVALDVGVRRGQAYVGGPMKAGAGEFAARV